MVAEIALESIPATLSLIFFEGRYWSLQKFHSCFHIVVHGFRRNFKFSNDRERPLTTVWKPGLSKLTDFVSLTICIFVSVTLLQDMVGMFLL